MGSGNILFTCPTVLFPHTLQKCKQCCMSCSACNIIGGKPTAKVNLRKVVEVVHVGTQCTLLCKGRHS